MEFLNFELNSDSIDSKIKPQKITQLNQQVKSSVDSSWLKHFLTRPIPSFWSWVNGIWEDLVPLDFIFEMNQQVYEVRKEG